MGLHPYADRYAVHPTLPGTGVPRDQILREIEEMSAAEDAVAHEGKISGSIYSGDEDHYAFLNEVFGHFSHANVLQRDVYPSATRFEGEIIAMTADLLHAPEPVGVLTSGGTESLMNPLLVYREWGRESGITRPNVVMPETAHPALHKGAHYFDIEVRLADVTDQFVADMASVRSLVDADTVALVGSAGTYPHGLIDPIGELSDLAVERGINLHVDGCLGGFVLCWAEDLGVPAPVFDFRHPGVTSMSADTHKYGFGLKGSSVLLYRSPELRRLQYFVMPDWSGGHYASPGMSGSRSGGIIASAWAAMVSLGREGYLAIAADIFATARRIREIVGEHPELRVLGDPLFNVAFAASTGEQSGVDPIDIFHVNDALAAKRWRLNGLQHPPAVHFCVTRPNTLPGVMDRFAEDLHEAVAYAREHRGEQPRSGATYGAGGLSVPRDRVAAGMAGWLDATQALPSG
ncbi:MAG: aminotransferase class V-fold PLP-dependent enzyme [Ilumatobacteraceae bacterium]|nr:aspartate aminotransferase family protein [Acidimicrobiales bacterium]MCB9392099.1 aspartate aminotransferase family protein [Acidimicrobiaceae bacterium]